MDDSINIQPEIHSWNDLYQNQSVSFPFVVDAADMKAFADRSGDRNPLHTDTVFAKSKGFGGAVDYGGLIVAQVSRLIGMHLPGRDSTWTCLKLNFRSPLMVGQEGLLEGRVLKAANAEVKWLRCVEIRPGFIETDMLNAFDTRYLEIERSRLPDGRFSTPDEVAAEIVDRLFEGTS